MAGQHRADRHEDSCGLACGTEGPDVEDCTLYVGRRRAEERAA